MTIINKIKANIKDNKKTTTIIVILVVLSIIAVIVYFTVFHNKPADIPETPKPSLYIEKISEDIRNNNFTTAEVLDIYDEYYNTLPEDINEIPYPEPSFSELLLSETPLSEILSEITPYPETTTIRPLLYQFKTHTFTNAGATGSIGPTLEQVRSAYNNITWKNQYINMVNDDGIQLWTVPRNGYYKINAIGAGGGGAEIFGKGRDVEITTYLKMNEVIKILIGQKGSIFNNNQGSGGGGTFVFKNNNIPIIVAGGGGGRGSTNEDLNSNALSSINGNNGGGDNQNTNTLYGKGGNYGNGGVNSVYAGGGGGNIGNGNSSINAFGGFSFSNGGKGGKKNTNNGSGGFGGGGSCIDSFGGGGGGGFSGGGGGGKDKELGWLGGGGGGSGQSGINYSNIVSLPMDTENMVNYRGKSDIFSIIITGNKNNNSSVRGTDIFTDDSNIVKAAMHSGIISDGETQKVYIEMLPGQQSYASSTKNSITSNSFGSFNGSYKFVSSPNKQLNTNIGDITPLIDNGSKNKDHGKVIITFISQTPPKQLENEFEKMRQKIIIDMEIYMISEKIRNKYEIDNKNDINQRLAEDAAKLVSEGKDLVKSEEERQKDLLKWTASVDIQKARLALFEAENIKKKELEKKILEMRETNNFEKTYSMRIPDKKPCSDWDSRLTDIGSDCWLNTYLRSAGTIPNKYPCSKWDSRYRETPTECYLDPVGRGWGDRPYFKSCSDTSIGGKSRYEDRSDSCWQPQTITKSSRWASLQDCPGGSYSNGVGDCWSDAHIYGKGCCCTIFGCCGRCGGGYADDGCTCRKRNIGVQMWRTQRAYCNSDEYSDGAWLCYKRCPSGYNDIGLLCEPEGGWPGTVQIWPHQRMYCPSNQVLEGLLCYDRCPSGYYASTVNICSPNEGAGVKVWLNQRQYCDDNKEFLDGLCYTKCAKGWSAVGTGAPTICTPDGGIGPKVWLNQRQYCKENEEFKAGLCYIKKEL